MQSYRSAHCFLAGIVADLSSPVTGRVSVWLRHRQGGLAHASGPNVGVQYCCGYGWSFASGAVSKPAFNDAVTSATGQPCSRPEGTLTFWGGAVTFRTPVGGYAGRPSTCSGSLARYANGVANQERAGHSLSRQFCAHADYWRAWGWRTKPFKSAYERAAGLTRSIAWLGSGAHMADQPRPRGDQVIAGLGRIHGTLAVSHSAGKGRIYGNHGLSKGRALEQIHRLAAPAGAARRRSWTLPVVRVLRPELFTGYLRERL